MVLSAMRSVHRPRVVVGVLLVEWWRSSSSVYAGVLDVRYSTFAPQEASSWLRVRAPRRKGPLDTSLPAGWCRPGFSWVCTNDGCGCGCPQHGPHIATLAIAGIAGLISLIALLAPFAVDRALGPIAKF